MPNFLQFIFFLFFCCKEFDFVNNGFIPSTSLEISTSLQTYQHHHEVHWKYRNQTVLLLRPTSVFLISLNLWCFLCSSQKTVYCCLDDMTLRCNAGEIIFSWAFKPFIFIWSYRIQYNVIQSFLLEDFQQVRTCSH